MDPKTEQLVEADVDRIAARARRWLTAIYTERPEGAEDLQMETFGIVGIFVNSIELDQDAPMGATGKVENCFTSFETTRRYSQEGILTAALREHDIAMRGNGY